jgi:hypothetical protein
MLRLKRGATELESIQFRVPGLSSGFVEALLGCVEIWPPDYEAKGGVKCLVEDLQVVNVCHKDLRQKTGAEEPYILPFARLDVPIASR